MTYASDLGLKVGSKIKINGSGINYYYGNILQLTEDDETEDQRKLRELKEQYAKLGDSIAAMEKK